MQVLLLLGTTAAPSFLLRVCRRRWFLGNLGHIAIQLKFSEPSIRSGTFNFGRRISFRLYTPVGTGMQSTLQLVKLSGVFFRVTLFKLADIE